MTVAHRSASERAVTALSFLEERLRDLEAAGRRRRRGVSVPEGVLCLCSNDYLGYATTGAIAAPMPPLAAGDDAGLDRGDADAVSHATRVGAGASRLISGDHPEHRALERTVADWVGLDDALVFSSGYAANVGLITALAGPGDVIVSDALNHASMIDGCRLSRASVEIVAHGDAEAFDRALAAAPPGARRFALSESYFSMDGDVADLVALRRACDANGAALLIDEAHALGVFGPRGAGLCAAAGVMPDALVGTFGKSVGGQGAFVAGATVLADWLWNRARSFVFSTGLSPLVAACDREGVAMARDDDAGRARLDAIASRLRGALRAMGCDVPATSRGPIIPILLGDEASAVAASRALLERGVWVSAIRPPTVPPGTSRLRVTVHARLGDADVERAISAFEAVFAR